MRVNSDTLFCDAIGKTTTTTTRMCNVRIYFVRLFNRGDGGGIFSVNICVCYKYFVLFHTFCAAKIQCVKLLMWI